MSAEKNVNLSPEMVERRIEMVEFKLALEANTKLTKEGLDLVKVINTTLHGEGENPGFIGNTKAQFLVHDKSINWLKCMTFSVCCLIIGGALIIIRTGMMG